ncbi:tetratricopeptide repeat-containing sensor histidine kinase [Algoriphagus terrigena]|uniref:tetratricopeptide repeat-containing sensor histidine kinase n=1 Tax=Algoriphagus terrigena TaxID=344884 RepID=UPI000426F8DD|nr:sensor histidine kinase [Algoriphagus terrigena]
MNKIFLVFLLALASFGALPASYGQSPAKKDTAEVTRLLLLATDQAKEIQEDSTALGSALAITSEAISLSKKHAYDSGLVRSYLTEYQVWIKAIERKIEDSLGFNAELNKLKVIEEKTAALLGAEKHAAWLGETFLLLAKAHNDYTTQTYEYKLTLYEQSISYFQKAGDLEQESNVWYRMGYTHHANGNLDRAEEAYLKAISVADAGGVKDTQHIYALLGNVYAFTGDFNLALKYELDALRISEENDDTLELGSIHLYLGLIYEPLKERASALKHYQIAFNEFKKNAEDHPSDLTHAAGNTAKMMIATGDPQGAITLLEETLERYPYVTSSSAYSSFPMRLMQAYMKLNDVTKAQKYCDELLLLNEKRPSPSTLSAALRFLVDTRQYQRAEQYLPAFQQMGESRGLKKTMAEAYHFRYQIDSVNHNYPGALKHHLMYTAVNNELFAESKTKEIAALQIQYDTKQKEKDILLLQQESLANKNEMQNAQSVRNGTFAGALLLIIILGMVYRQYRSKQKNNRYLERLLTEKELLLKEVHHRVKNNLQTVLSLLESQSRKLTDDALMAISETQSRVYTMSLIHKKLYQSEDVAAINIKDYLTELIQHLSDSYGNRAARLTCTAVPITVDLSQAVPLGLIINEAVTNSFKHAFHQNSLQNEIHVELTKVGVSEVMLTIEDNGSGMPLDAKDKRDGLGLKLIRGLTEDLEGSLAIHSDGGLKITVAFSVTEPLNKINYVDLTLSA